MWGSRRKNVTQILQSLVASFVVHFYQIFCCYSALLTLRKVYEGGPFQPPEGGGGAWVLENGSNVRSLSEAVRGNSSKNPFPHGTYLQNDHCIVGNVLR